MERELLRYLEPYDPGIFPAMVTERYGIPESRVANLASNENPYPLPGPILGVLRKALEHANRYPDPSYRRGKAAVAAYLGCTEDRVSLGERGERAAGHAGARRPQPARPRRHPRSLVFAVPLC